MFTPACIVWLEACINTLYCHSPLIAHVLRLVQVAHVVDVCTFVSMLKYLYSLRMMSLWLMLMLLLAVALHVHASNARACNDTFASTAIECARTV